ncbi:MAG: hypothetical protein ACR2FS_13485 [Phormidesmis sp.]
MDQIQKLEQQIEQMAAELAQSAKAQRRTAVEAELSRQAPTAPEIVRRLALAELGGGEDVAGEVSSFLKGESVATLLEQPKQQRKQATQQAIGNRPSLEQMLGDVQNGNAQFKIG